MSELEKHLTNGANGQVADHPLLRLLAEREKSSDVEEVRLEVRRPRDALGFQLAEIYLDFIGKDDREIEYQ